MMFWPPKSIYLYALLPERAALRAIASVSTSPNPHKMSLPKPSTFLWPEHLSLPSPKLGRVYDKIITIGNNL
jgi:hypothetical protein